MECCKPIPNTNGRYSISSDGLVKNVETGKTIIGDVNNAGYYRVSLLVNGKQKHLFRHRLVAEAFIPNPDNLPEVDHRNGVKSDNRVENLHWITRSGNERAARRTGIKKGYCPLEVLYDNGDVKFFETKQELAETLGITRAAVKFWVRPKDCGKVRNDGYRKYGIKSIKVSDSMR